MTTFTVGFDNKWQATFDDEGDAISWAQEVAGTGRTVEVVKRRFGFCSFLTAFPESERAALKARWKRPVGVFIGGAAGGVYGSAAGGCGGGEGGAGGGEGGSC